MKEMYIILGWIGWIWLVVAMTLIGLGLLIQHRRRRKEQLRGFQVIHNNDEKQS